MGAEDEAGLPCAAGRAASVGSTACMPTHRQETVWERCCCLRHATWPLPPGCLLKRRGRGRGLLRRGHLLLVLRGAVRCAALLADALWRAGAWGAPSSKRGRVCGQGAFSRRQGQEADVVQAGAPLRHPGGRRPPCHAWPPHPGLHHRLLDPHGPCPTQQGPAPGATAPAQCSPPPRNDLPALAGDSASAKSMSEVVRPVPQL